jgi:hypothetical protein
MALPIYTKLPMLPQVETVRNLSILYDIYGISYTYAIRQLFAQCVHSAYVIVGALFLSRHYTIKNPREKKSKLIYNVS